MAEPEENGEEKKVEVKKEEKIETKETFTKVENSENDDWSSFFDNKLWLALLAIVIGLIIGYYIIPKIVELIRERQGQNDYIDFWPEQFQHAPWHYRPLSNHIEEPKVASPPLHRTRSAIDPLMEMRTPDNLKRHGIYLDDRGEAILMDQTVFETWSIQRNTQGKIVDAHRVDDDELEFE